MKRLAATLMVGMCLTLTGGGIAQAYPPEDTTPSSETDVSPSSGTTLPSSPSSETTVPIEAASSPAVRGASGEELPATGSNGTTSVLLLAAGLSGSGLLLAGAVRRRRTPSA